MTASVESGDDQPLLLTGLRRGVVWLGGKYLRTTPIRRGRLRMERCLTRFAGERLLRYGLEPGVTLDLDLRDKLQSIIFYEGAYESDVLNWMRRLLSPGAIFADIGANVGLHTVIASRLVGPHGYVDGFEPEPLCRARLEHHLRLNACTNVYVHSYALSDRSGTARLHISPAENSAKSSFAEANVTLGLSTPSPGSLEVETRTLDNHVAQSARLPDVIKIDVEGAELLVVKGAAEVLSAPAQPAILFEASDLQASAFGYRTADLKAELSSYGYQIFRGQSGTLEPVGLHEPHRLENLLALTPLHRDLLARVGDRHRRSPN